MAIQFQMISAGAAGGGLWRFVLVGGGLGIGEVGSRGWEKLAVTMAGEGVVELDGGIGGSHDGIVMV